MYPINIKIRNNSVVSNVSDAWIKMINDDMNSCVSNLKKKHAQAKFKSEAIINKRMTILKFCAAQMIETSKV
jgi:hypothetical protein